MKVLKSTVGKGVFLRFFERPWGLCKSSDAPSLSVVLLGVVQERRQLRDGSLFFWKHVLVFLLISPRSGSSYISDVMINILSHKPTLCTFKVSSSCCTYLFVESKVSWPEALETPAVAIFRTS